jgi:DNA-binding transcriptional LysR family regulator
MDRGDLANLSAFVAVADQRSFGAAASRLDVTPSALSHSMRQLEAGLGVRLLSRALVQIAGAGKRPVLYCRDFKLGARHSTLQAQVDLGQPDVSVRIVPCGCDAWFCHDNGSASRFAG